MNEQVIEENVITQEEVDTIIAEYKHQQMLEHMVGPLVSMIVHVVGVFLVVIMASVDGKPAAPKTEVTMMPIEEVPPLEDVTEPEPIEPDPIEVEVPEIVLAPPSDSAAGDPSPADIISPEGAQFTIPDSNSPFKVNVPAGNSRGAFGFGGKGTGGGGGGNGSGGGGAPYMNGKFYDFKQNNDRSRQLMSSQARGNAGLTNKQSKEYAERMKIVYAHMMSGSRARNPGLEGVYCAEENGRPIILRSGGIYIPIQDANGAPKAYGVEKKVNPSYWMAHYQATLVVGHDMECRFWGEGDDSLSVLIDNAPVLMAGYSGPDVSGNSYGLAGVPASGEMLNGLVVTRAKFIPGKWITLKKGQRIKIDICLGEIPGGLFGARLCIEKKGETYKKGKGGQPMYPLFTTVEIMPDNIVDENIRKGYEDKIFDVVGGMLNATTEDVYFERIDKIKLVIE